MQKTPRTTIIRVSIPVGVTATVHVPSANPTAVLETAGGKRVVADRAEGVDLVGVHDGRSVFRIGSGDYPFEVANP